MACSWRNGPAKLWYDMIEVPQDCQHFDYGFKKKSAEEIEHVLAKDPDDAFFMVTQRQWEKEVIWDIDNNGIKEEVLKDRCKRKRSLAGWIPEDDHRNAPDFVQSLRNDSVKEDLTEVKEDTKKRKRKTSTTGEEEKKVKVKVEPFQSWVSTLPVENQELISSCWENQVIWDPEAMEEIPSPKVVPLDPNDEDVILTVDENSNSCDSVINLFKNPFNISNDEFYTPINKPENDLTLKVNIRHSTPALELWEMFFPTFIKRNKLLHKPKLKASCFDRFDKKHRVEILKTEPIKDRCDNFYDFNGNAVTALTGEIVLMEYAEEFPPFLMRIGMASKIHNYYKRKSNCENDDSQILNQFKYGQMKLCHQAPFLGNLQTGQCLQALENNLFRAPLYHHETPESDFLVIKRRKGFYLKEISGIFTTGQELPLFEVPVPNSRKAKDFLQKFLLANLYRFFHHRKSVNFEDITEAFPQWTEDTIKKKINFMVSFKRRTIQGKSKLVCTLKPDFNVPTEDDILNLISPEECCAYYSMVEAENRLNDIGLHEKLALYEDDENQQENANNEIKSAPWNTTRAFLTAASGKSLLQFNEIDIKNCDGLFTYVAIGNKVSKIDQDDLTERRKSLPKRTKNMNLKQARDWLVKYGLSTKEVKKLNRWEALDAVKKLSEELKNESNTKVSRREKMENFYNKKKQTIFDYQNQLFSSKEELSTDEESDSDLDDLGKDLESMINDNNKTRDDVEFEREEIERLELIKKILCDKKDEGTENINFDNIKQKKFESYEGKALKITRVFEEDGQKFVRTEIIRKADVIDIYLRIKEMNDQKCIDQLCNSKLHMNKVLEKSKSNKKPKLQNNSLPNLIDIFDESKQVVVNDVVVKFPKSVVEKAFEISRIERENKRRLRSWK